LGFGDNALREVEPASSIERNDENTAKHAAKECCNPLCAVLSPEYDAVAGRDLAVHQLGGEALCKIRQVAVSGNLLTISAMDKHGLLRAVLAVIIDERGQM
jgi:hypothetical protein